MPARRPCPTPGCPALLTKAERYCPTCTRTRDQARGTKQQRGYDKSYDRTRKRLDPRVATGQVRCARCHQLIAPGQPWALDHTDDRLGLLGPSHATCNNRAGGQAAHR